MVVSMHPDEDRLVGISSGRQVQPVDQPDLQRREEALRHRRRTVIVTIADLRASKDRTVRRVLTGCRGGRIGLDAAQWLISTSTGLDEDLPPSASPEARPHTDLATVGLRTGLVPTWR